MMTKEERELVYKELCTRLPYRTIVSVYSHQFNDGSLELLTPEHLKVSAIDEFLEIKPYLHPMSSMTEEEYENFRKTFKWSEQFDEPIFEWTCESYDWLNAHHFDYRGLITMGLALEAPEDMYSTNTN